MGCRRLGLVFRVELRADKPRMIMEFEDLDEGAVGARAGESNAGGFEGRAQIIIDFIAVAVALGDLAFAVDGADVRVVGEFAEIGTQAHGAAFVFDVLLCIEEMDDGMRRVGDEFRGVGVLPAADVAGVFDEGHLHAEADAEEGNLMGACVLDGADFPFGAADAKTARNEDAVHLTERVGEFVFRQILEFFAVNIVKPDVRVIGITAVVQGFDEALVGFAEFDVFSDEGDIDGVFWVSDDVADALPLGSIGFAGPDLEEFRDPVIEPLLVEIRRHHINAGHILCAEDAVFMDVAEERELSSNVVGKVAFAAAEKDIGLDTDLTQSRHGMLRRLRLHFVGRFDVGDEGDVDIDHVVAGMFRAELADGFEEGEGFDVADGAADFDDRDVAVLRALDEEGLDLVGDVRNDLYGAAQIVAVAFFCDDVVIDAAGCAVIGLPRLCVREPLVMAQIHIGFGAVLRDIDFAMLEGVHGTRIDVDIGIEFDEVDA